MEIEMYVGLSDNTWYLTNIEIPDSTSKEEIQKVAENKLYKELEKEKVKDVSFVGVYHIG